MSREDVISEIVAQVRANQVLTDMLDERAAEYLGINRTDARALDVIDQKGQITAGELARELRISTGAVTTLVDRLERAGYARRTRDSDDRRRVLVEITPIVQENAEKIYGTWRDVIPLYDGYTDEELELVLRFQYFGREWLEKALARMEALAEERPEPPKRPPEPARRQPERASRAGPAGTRTPRRRRRPS
jgi:DNA-binding MarR family transcriptional regulator